MKILLACYHTRRLKESIEEKGHDVLSCDLKKSWSSGKHYQGNVLDLHSEYFDLIIAFPPCTYLCKAQYGLLEKSEDRRLAADNAIQFVKSIWSFNSPQVAIENPIGLLNSNWKKPSQIIRPWHFGDPYRKDICLWLRGLPPLMSTCFSPLRKSISNHVNGRMSQVKKSEIRSSWDYFPGTCQAMADQWSTARPLVYPTAALWQN